MVILVQPQLYKQYSTIWDGIITGKNVAGNSPNELFGGTFSKNYVTIKDIQSSNTNNSK